MPPGLVRAAGHRLVRLQARAAGLTDGRPGVRVAAAGTCPYAIRVTQAADLALRADPGSVLAVPWGCDGLRRAADLLGAAWPDRVRSFPVPRDAAPASVRLLARELRGLEEWLRTNADRHPPDSGDRDVQAVDEDVFLDLPDEPRPEGVMVVSGPLSHDDLLCFLEDRGAGVAGIESCLGPARRTELQALADPALGPDEQARRLLETIVCPHRSRTLRRQRLEQRFRETQAGAVVYLRQTFCDPGAYDSLTVAELAAEMGLPFLELDAEFPFRLDGPMRTRLEAFLEAHQLGGSVREVEAAQAACDPDDVFLDADLFLDPSEA